MFCCCILSYPFYTLSVYLRKVYLSNYNLLSNYRLKIYTILLSRPGYILIYSTIAMAVDGVSGTDCWDLGMDCFVDYESDDCVRSDQENLDSGAAHSFAQNSENLSNETHHTPAEEKVRGASIETSPPLKPKSETLETPNLAPQENKPGRSHFRDNDISHISSSASTSGNNTTQTYSEEIIVHSTKYPIKVITPNGAIRYIPLKSTISSVQITDVGSQSDRFNYPTVHQIPLIQNQWVYVNPNIHRPYLIPLTVCVRFGIAIISVLIPSIVQSFFP